MEPTLPRYLRPGLRLVCIGYNPSLYSAQAGHYYARPGNAFWRQLNASGLVARPVGPQDDAQLMDEAGIGFSDLCPRATPAASDLNRAEIEVGAQRLYDELHTCQPRVALFNGRQIFQWFSRYTPYKSLLPPGDVPLGEQPQPLGSTRMWVVPSSSGLASRWHRVRLDLLQQLAAMLDEPEQ